MLISFLKILVAAIVLVGLAWVAIAIKMFVQKNGKFTKSCGSVDAVSGKPVGCSCDMNRSETCKNT